jgi:hypothetical protein
LEVAVGATEALREPADSAGLFTALLDRFGALGGVELDLPRCPQDLGSSKIDVRLLPLEGE